MGKWFVGWGLVLVVTLWGAASRAAEEPSAGPRWRPGIWNSLYAYNGENSAWEQTRITITYFENLFEPFVELDVSPKVAFKAGAGLVVPLDQEQKIRSWYPVIQSKIRFDGWHLELGSLDGKHDFPAPLLDPLIGLVPQIRLGAGDVANQIPINYEAFPVTGKHSHGRYEYGFAFRWYEGTDRGELYMNWQLPDTANHRERFDVGLTDRRRLAGLPVYLGAHYWHNGGHENLHPVPVTENYTVGLGLRDDSFSALVLGSLFYANRDTSSAVGGAALYFDYTWRLGQVWRLQPLLFVSDELRNRGNRFISIEGDPFFRAPFYVGINVGAHWEIFPACDLDFGLVNGFFQRSAGDRFKPSMTRFDQMLRFNLRYVFGEKS